MKKRVPRRNIHRWTDGTANIFRQCYLNWQFTLLSCLVDPILVLYLPAQFSAPVGLSLALIISLGITPLLSHSVIHRALARVRESNRLDRIDPRLVSGLVVALGGMITALKMTFITSLPLTPALLLLGFVLVVLQRSSQQIIEAIRVDTLRFRNNPTLYVHRWSQQLLIFSTIPLLASRLISFIGVVTFGLGKSGLSEVNALMNLAPLWIASIIFIVIQKPRATLFMGHCVRCKHPVSPILVSFGSCPNCDRSFRG